ncbi:MAG TPA: hypothetical protein P5201_04105, partial [Aminobacteriaceae bacterium]|nr:hypothetical protein [Aminobacteriaceae bacterium]
TPEKILPLAGKKHTITASEDSTVRALNARKIGEGVKRLGGGRMSLGEPIDLSVGVRILKKNGASAGRGEALLEILYSDEAKLADAMPFFESAYTFGKANEHSEDTAQRRLILGKIG